MVATTAQEITRLEISLLKALDDRQYDAAKYMAVTLSQKIEILNCETAEFLYRREMIQMNPQDIIDVENAQFSDWVYFTEEYDAGNVIVPAETGGRVCTDRMPDEVPVSPGYHDVQIDINGKYYEIEVPYDVLGMQ